MNNFTYIDPQIQKATSRGQITLPIAWRRQMRSRHFVVRTLSDRLEIRPARLEATTQEFTVFDAIRDNKGKGIKATDLIKILNKTHPAL